MKAAVSLPDDVFMAAEAMVEARGWTRSRLYSEALRTYLKQQDPADVTARLDQVHSKELTEPELRRRANRAVLGATDW
jgi:metal-responsive CopG/Arc/MetJ family transcriptional regulator